MIPGAALVIAAALGSTAAAEPHVGVMADLGVPDGATASVVVRPVRAIRLHGGVGHNLVTRGVRVGITLAPLATTIAPTLSVDYGRYPEGDANPLMRRLTGDAMYHATALERVGYAFANAHLGIEVGGRRGRFFLHAGASRISGRLHGLTDPDGAVAFTEDPRATVWSVSARLGFLAYLR